MKTEFKEILALHEIGRRLGIPPDSIHVGWFVPNKYTCTLCERANGSPVCAVQFTQGSISFVIHSNISEFADRDEWTSEWTASVRWCNKEASAKEVEQIYFESSAYKMANTILLELLKKGFNVPAFPFPMHVESV